MDTATIKKNICWFSLWCLKYIKSCDRSEEWDKNKEKGADIAMSDYFKTLREPILSNRKRQMKNRIK